MKNRKANSRGPSAEPTKMSPSEIADIRYRLLDETWHRRASNAQTQIFQLEALLDCIDQRIDDSPDEHLASLLELSKCVCADLRRELYGEAGSP